MLAMKSIKILIVEDQFLTAERMKYALETRGYKVTGIAASGLDAMSMMANEPAEIILMDIRLNGKIEGIITAKAIQERYPVTIIYITELNDQKIFQDAKETFPRNYLLKPFHDNSIFNAIELAIQQPKSLYSESPFDDIRSIVDDRVFIQTKEGFFEKRLLSDILYVQSKGAYSDIFFESNDQRESKFCISLSSNKLVERIGYPGMVRVHKSYYVNFFRIEGIQNADLIVKGANKNIPIGREFKSEFDKRIKYLKHNPN